jgi:hypothetical protein
MKKLLQGLILFRKITYNIMAIIDYIMVIALSVYVCVRVIEKPVTQTPPAESNAVEVELSNGGTVQAGNTPITNYVNNATIVVDSQATTFITPYSKGGPKYDVIRVPKSFTYTTVLPDGTRVRLNAASCLKVPTDYGVSKREIYLEGEGYLQVTGNGSHVFTIHTPYAEILVLGTQLNVQTYDDMTRVVLVSGSAIVTCNEKKRQLTPGQAASADKYKRMLHVEPFEKNRELGWLNGRYFYYGKSMRQIGNILERCYNVVVIVDSERNDLRYTGFIFKGNTLQTSLQELKRCNFINSYIDEKGRVHLQ